MLHLYLSAAPLLRSTATRTAKGEALLIMPFLSVSFRPARCLMEMNDPLSL